MFKNTKISIVVLLGLIIGIFLPIMLTYLLFSKSYKERSEQTINIITESISISASEALWFFSSDWTKVVVQSAVKNEKVYSATIYDSSKLKLAHMQEKDSISNPREITVELKKNGDFLGILTLVFNMDEINKDIYIEKDNLLWILILQAIVSSIILYFIIKYKILKPINILISQSRKLSKKQLDEKFIWEQKDEFGKLGNTIDDTRRSLKDAFTQLEQEKRKAQNNAKQKSEFLAIMSHEIRTPMTGIIGMCHLVLQTALETNQRNFITKIDKSTKKLLKIINDILDFSKVEAGKLKIEKKDFDISDLINDIKDIVMIKIEEKGLRFEIDFDKKRDVYLGDELRLHQILLNLINNSIKFTDHGKVSLIISNISDDKVRFEVKDTGIGISKEDQEKLFKAFSQVDEGGSRRFGGTGLGLVIVKQFVELMGGKIWCESKKDKGSSFIFEIDLPMGDRSKINKQVKEIKKDDYDLLRDKTILLVEDNKINQEIINTFLENVGVIVDIADNGEEALELFKRNEQEYDLILMDIQMPIMDGVETTKQIRKMNKAIPIIALTASINENIEEINNIGMNGYLGKPIDVNSLYINIMDQIKNK